MAGYDFQFAKPDAPDREIRATLNAFRRIAEVHRLDFRYRTVHEADGINILGWVDGSLQAIQSAQDDLGELATGYMLAVATRDGVDRARRVWNDLYRPMLDANEERVRDLSDSMFESAGQLRGRVRDVLAEDVRLESHVRSSRLAPAQRFALSQFIEMFRLWRDREVSGVNAVIAFDHSFELFLKPLAGARPSQRLDHPDLLSTLRAQGKLTGQESHRLARFHRCRNRCQHRGYRVRATTVDAFAQFGRGLYWKLLTGRPPHRDRGHLIT